MRKREIPGSVGNHAPPQMNKNSSAVTQNVLKHVFCQAPDSFIKGTQITLIFADKRKEKICVICENLRTKQEKFKSVR